MKRSAVGYIPSAIAVFLSIGVMTAFRACARPEDGMWMNCHNVQMCVFAAGILSAACTIAPCFFNYNAHGKIMSVVSSVTGIVIMIVCALLPGRIMHMCMMADMRCNSLMKPFTTVMSVMFIVSSAILTAMSASNKENGRKHGETA